MAGYPGALLGTGDRRIDRGIGMQIHGFNKTTLLDYPEHVAATVFTGGCNFRCPFCHNGGLVLDPAGQEQIAEEEVLSYLQKRQGILDGVCITGGEPTLQSDLKNFIKQIKQLGYAVKLDTNGYRPGVLWDLLSDGLLDYVAMDIKASKENYVRAAGVRNLDISAIEESVAILKSSKIPYEFRTTVVKGIHSVEEFEVIGRWLEGCHAYYLQAFRENENLVEMYMRRNDAAGNAVFAGENIKFSAFPRKDMENMADTARKYIDKVGLRGVE